MQHEDELPTFDKGNGEKEDSGLLSRKEDSSPLESPLGKSVNTENTRRSPTKHISEKGLSEVFCALIEEDNDITVETNLFDLSVLKPKTSS